MRLLQNCLTEVCNGRMPYCRLRDRRRMVNHTRAGKVDPGYLLHRSPASRTRPSTETTNALRRVRSSRLRMLAPSRNFWHPDTTKTDCGIPTGRRHLDTVRHTYLLVANLKTSRR